MMQLDPVREAAALPAAGSGKAKLEKAEIVSQTEIRGRKEDAKGGDRDVWDGDKNTQGEEEEDSDDELVERFPGRERGTVSILISVRRRYYYLSLTYSY